MFSPAAASFPDWAKRNVSRLNIEKVVNPPQMPVMTNCRWRVLAKTRPPGLVSVAKKPMMKEPTTLTKKVPQGNPGPISARVAIEASARNTPPMTAPSETML
jgi:hypothetical protein